MNLTDTQIRSLPDTLTLGEDDYCVICGSSAWLRDLIHVRNVGAGGRKKQGPRLHGCRKCHRLLHDAPASFRLDITTEGELLWTEPGGSKVIDRIPEDVLIARPDLFGGDAA